MKRILHVIAGNLFGGVESFLVTLANSLPKNRGIEHLFAICYEGRLSKEISNSGCCMRLIGPARILNPAMTAETKKNLSRMVTDTNPDLIVCHMSWAQILFGGVSQKNLPWVAHHHGPFTGSVLDFLAVWTKPDLIISPSRHSAITWEKKYKRPVRILNYPVRQAFSQLKEACDRKEAKRLLGFPDDKILILQCSRIERWKGHDILLAALKLIKYNPEWLMVFGGEPQKKDDEVFFKKLIGLCHKYELVDRVKWIGNVENVRGLMEASDIYCQANRGPEGFSLAFLEASFCGLPIVTTNLGGASEIVESNGFLVQKADSALFANALLKLIEDGALRAAQSQAALIIGREKGDPENQIIKYEEICFGVRSYA